MRLPTRAALILGAALTFALPIAATLALPTFTPPPLCAAQARTTPTSVPGFYRVTISLAPDCAADAVADVRLESYVGGTYPRRGWWRVTRRTPLVRDGVPWYWRASWRAASGKPYPLPVPGMRAP